jgi:hypothetical protein
VTERDLVAFVFDQLTRDKFRSRSKLSEFQAFRLNVASACGPLPSEPVLRGQVRAWIAVRRSWDAYFTAAKALNLMTDNPKDDLLARLRDLSDDNFRGSLAECTAAWYLAGKLKLDVSVRPLGRGNRKLELKIILPDGDAAVEVKAPHREMLPGITYGSDAPLLQASIDGANRQFARDGRNLLVIVLTHMSLQLRFFRRAIIEAFFGQETFSFPMDPVKGADTSKVIPGFLLTGRFTKFDRNRGGPRFTSVGAVLFLQPIHGHHGIEHNALLVHNPHAKIEIPKEIWGAIPQLVRKEDQMVWTDGGGLDR